MPSRARRRCGPRRTRRPSSRLSAAASRDPAGPGFADCRPSLGRTALRTSLARWFLPASRGRPCKRGSTRPARAPPPRAAAGSHASGLRRRGRGWKQARARRSCGPARRIVSRRDPGVRPPPLRRARSGSPACPCPPRSAARRRSPFLRRSGTCRSPPLPCERDRGRGSPGSRPAPRPRIRRGPRAACPARCRETSARTPAPPPAASAPRLSLASNGTCRRRG